jgi:hypothetical protein
MTARSQRDHQDFAEAHVARIVDRLRLERSLLCQRERDASGHNNPAMAIAPTVSYRNSIAAIAGNDPAHSHGRQHSFSSFAPRASIAAYSVLLFLSIGLELGPKRR